MTRFILKKIGVVLAVALVTGCTINRPIEGSNNSAPTGMVRFSVGDESLRTELNLSSTSGDFTQTIGAGEQVEIDGHSFSGPAVLDGDAVIDFGALTLRSSNYPQGGVVGFELGGGFGYASTRLRLESVKHSEGGLALGGGGALLLRQRGGKLGLRVGANYFIIPVHGSVTQYELLATLRPNRNVELLAGLQGVELRLYDAYYSDIELRYSGPTIGVHMYF